MRPASTSGEVAIATRRERVVLDLEDNLTSGLARAAVAAKVLERNLNGLDGAGVRVQRGVGPLGTANGPIGSLGSQSRRASDDINHLTGRLRLFADAAAILGPATLPVAAVAVPAIAGLANQLGFAAAAGGTAVLAFQGVGDALKALNKAALEPSGKNLREAERLLRDLSPAAAEFTIKLHDMAGDFRSLRDAAANGLFPGLIDGFDRLGPVLDRMEPVLERFGQTIGEIFAGGVGDLAGGRWDDFFTFLEVEAKPTLTELAATAGDFAHGLAEMWRQFQPLNASFGGWLREVAAGFDSWATGLDQSEGFANFIDYIRETGPQVAATMGALGNALVQIAQAAAPLGGPVLEALEAVADAVATIADSDIGTPLIAGMAAMAAITRATKLWEATSKTAMGQFIVGQAQGAKGVRSLSADLKAMRAEYAGVGKAQAVMLSGLSNTTGAAQRTRASLASLGKTAGVIGGLAVATSGLADDLGVANTASLGLLGAMVRGGPGALAGGLIGATMDFAAVGKEAAQVIRQFDNAARDSGGSISGYIANLQAGQEAANGFVDSLGLLGSARVGIDALISGGFEDTILGKLGAEADMAEEKIGDLEFAGRELAFQLGMVGERSKVSFGQMDEALLRVAPAMQDLGLTVDDLIQGVRDGSIVQMVEDMAAWQRAADSTAGRTAAVGEAIRNLGSDMTSTESAAKALEAALDALLGPNLNLSAATDQWTTALRTLDDELAEHSRALEGNTQGAITNREAIRSRISDLTEMLQAEAEAGAGPRKLAAMLENQTKALLDAGEAAGLSRKELSAYLREMGLTPALIRTVFEAAGISKVEQQARNLRSTYEGLPKKARTDIEANGIPQTMGQVNALVKRYDLTEKQRTALIRLKDLASKDLNAVLRALGIVDKYTATPTVTAQDNASGTIANVLAKMRSLDGTTAVTYIATRHLPKADGGYISGPGGPTDDKIPAMLSNGEFVMRAAAVKRYGVAAMYAMNEMKLAAGGLVNMTHAKRLANGGTAGPWNDSVIGMPGESVFEAFAGRDRSDMPAFLRRMFRNLDQLDNGLRGLNKRELKMREKQLEREEKSLEKWLERREDLAKKELDADKKRLDDMIAARDAFVDQVLGQFRSQVFGIEDPEKSDDILRVDNANLKNAMALWQQLKARGFDGAAFRELAANGNVEALQYYLSLPDVQLQELENLFNERDRLLGQAGSLVGDLGFGKEIAGLRSDYRESLAVWRDVRADNREYERAAQQRFNRLERKLDQIPEKIAKGVSRAVNNAAAAGAQGRAAR